MDTTRFRAFRILMFVVALFGPPAMGGAQLFEVDETLLAGPGAPQAAARQGAALVSADIDGDGRADLLVGAPLRDQTVFAEAGVDAGGVVTFGFTPDRAVTIGPEFQTHGRGHRRGSAIALGDFDGDGAPDVASGAPGAGVGNVEATGLVMIEMSYAGAVERFFLHQDTEGMGGQREAGDEFGAALAVGDFDGDSFDDLAIGVPGEAVDSVSDAGAVHVVYGSADGLEAEGSQFLLLGEGGLPGGSGLSDLFGFSLAAGDFDGDGRDDLAIGMPGHDPLAPVQKFNSGKVLVVHGSSIGLVSDGFLFLDEGDLANGVEEEDDHFGWALAVGDFDRTSACMAAEDCADDLVIGIPGENLGDDTRFAGKVMIVLGDEGFGLRVAHTMNLTTASMGLTPLRSAHFGEVLATGRLGADLSDDLAIGEPFRRVDNIDSGAAHVVLGGPQGLSAIRRQTIVPAPGLSTFPARAGDDFGAALAIGDFDGDGTGDLAIGAPGRDLGAGGTLEEAGAVQVLFGALFASGFEGGTTTPWITVLQ
ncbi:MAG: VCBS repeat-containing protein [Thermoanaerobaculia bacterium]|nr:VCBS repeat-containing protein [Thermoanaerobaculia bacterium]